MQFRDLKAQYQALKPMIDKGIMDAIESSQFILGKPVSELEEMLAEYVGRKYCVTCANGTDALTLSMMAYDIGEGDAIFTSDFTYFASAGSASILGAKAYFADIDERTFNISPESLEDAIERCIIDGEYTPKAIIPVDLFGLPADYEKIEIIAKKYNLLIIEDAAQGFGGSINGKIACSFGDISTTSFFPAKPLGCYGDGGAIFTDSLEIAERLKSLRAQGKSPVDKYDNREIGMNSRLDTLQAAILIPKFKAFKAYEVENVNKVARWYNERLADKFTTPYIPEGFTSSWAQYTLILDSEEKREEIREKLKVKGIPSMVYYPRGLHSQEAYKDMNLLDELYPNTVKATKTVLSLPMHPYLDEQTVEYISKVLLEE